MLLTSAQAHARHALLRQHHAQLSVARTHGSH